MLLNTRRGGVALVLMFLSACAASNDQESSLPSTATEAPPSAPSPTTVSAFGEVQVEINMEAILSDPNRRAGGPCVSAAGYDDIRAGADVVISNNAGATIALGQLDPGILRADSKQVNAGWCAFEFVVKNVAADQSFYGIAVGGRDVKPLSREDLSRSIQLQLGESKVVPAPS